MARRITEAQLLDALTDEVKAFETELDNAIEDGNVDAVTLKIEEAKTWQTQAAGLSLTNSRPVQSLSRKMATIAAKAARWLNSQEAPEPEPQTPPSPLPSSTPATNSNAPSNLPDNPNPPPPDNPNPPPPPLEANTEADGNPNPPEPNSTATDDPPLKPEESAAKPAPKTAALRRL